MIDYIFFKVWCIQNQYTIIIKNVTAYRSSQYIKVVFFVLEYLRQFQQLEWQAVVIKQIMTAQDIFYKTC